MCKGVFLFNVYTRNGQDMIFERGCGYFFESELNLRIKCFFGMVCWTIRRFDQSEQKCGNEQYQGLCNLFYGFGCFSWWFYGGGVV